jgi:hypothetical protein
MTPRPNAQDGWLDALRRAIPDTEDTPMTTTTTDLARCGCGAQATNQALYRREDGTHFLGGPVCDRHRYLLGPLTHALGAEVVDHIEVAP